MDKSGLKSAREKTYPMNLTERELKNLGSSRWFRSKMRLVLLGCLYLFLMSLLFFYLLDWFPEFWMRLVVCTVYYFTAIVPVIVFIKKQDQAGKDFLQEIKNSGDNLST